MIYMKYYVCVLMYEIEHPCSPYEGQTYNIALYLWGHRQIWHAFLVVKSKSFGFRRVMSKKKWFYSSSIL